MRMRAGQADYDEFAGGCARPPTPIHRDEWLISASCPADAGPAGRFSGLSRGSSSPRGVRNAEVSAERRMLFAASRRCCVVGRSFPYLFPRQLDGYTPLRPAHVADESWRDEHLVTEPPVARVHDEVSNGPPWVIEEHHGPYQGMGDAGRGPPECFHSARGLGAKTRGQRFLPGARCASTGVHAEQAQCVGSFGSRMNRSRSAIVGGPPERTIVGPRELRHRLRGEAIAARQPEREGYVFTTYEMHQPCWFTAKPLKTWQGPKAAPAVP